VLPCLTDAIGREPQAMKRPNKTLETNAARTQNDVHERSKNPGGVRMCRGRGTGMLDTESILPNREGGGAEQGAVSKRVRGRQSGNFPASVPGSAVKPEPAGSAVF